MVRFAGVIHAGWVIHAGVVHRGCLLPGFMTGLDLCGAQEAPGSP